MREENLIFLEAGSNLIENTVEMPKEKTKASLRNKSSVK